MMFKLFDGTFPGFQRFSGGFWSSLALLKGLLKGIKLCSICSRLLEGKSKSVLLLPFFLSVLVTETHKKNTELAWGVVNGSWRS